MGIPREEAAELLRKGDTGFISGAELPADFSRAQSRLRELFLIHPAAPFYAGLLLEAERASVPKVQSPGRELVFHLFSAALESPSFSARREAAFRLVSMLLEDPRQESENGASIEEADKLLSFLDSENMEGKDPPPLLRGAALYRLGRFEEAAEFLAADSADPPEKALALFAALKSVAGQTENTKELKEEILSFLFRPLPAETRHWARDEALLMEGFLTPAEQSALSSRLFPGDYRTVLENLRPALSDGGTVFFRYPELLRDLGMAYLYNPPFLEEGAELFAAWDRLTSGAGESFAPPPPLSGANEPGDCRELAAFIGTMNGEELKERRYRILYHSGRIARTREEYGASSEYFARALDIAPDALASDSCVWYMLMNAMAESPRDAASLVVSTMPRWNDMSYFEDILDRLSRYLAAGRHWNTMLEIFSSLERGAGGVSLAQYAWILGRAAEEGYIDAGREAESFFTLAFEKGSLYYRIMAASKLGINFVPEESSGGEDDGTKARTDEAEFLLGFFDCGASSLAPPYIRKMEKALSASGLRELAELLADGGLRKESLDLVSRYTLRENFRTSREDLLLLYPRPFGELVEKHAAEAGFGAELLYGLIRTESFFESAIVSRAGAVGLAQLMAPTAADMAGRIARQGGPDYRGADGIDLTDPETSIHIGAYYLRYLTEQMGSPIPGLLAYNGGMGRMRRWLAGDREKGGLPQDLFLETIEYPETREYGRRVLAAAAVYGYLYYGMSMEAAAALYR